MSSTWPTWKFDAWPPLKIAWTRSVGDCADATAGLRAARASTAPVTARRAKRGMRLLGGSGKGI